MQAVAHFDPHEFVITVTFPNQHVLMIHKHDIQISHFSHGAGGQNVNKHMNGVQLIYKIPDALHPVGHPDELTVRAGRERSLEQNMHQAFVELKEALEKYFYVAPERYETRAPYSAKIKRHHEKKLQSLKKSFRRKEAGL